MRDLWTFDVRKTILEAHSTLYYVNESDEIKLEVVDDLKEVLKVTMLKNDCVRLYKPESVSVKRILLFQTVSQNI